MFYVLLTIITTFPSSLCAQQSPTSIENAINAISSTPDKTGASATDSKEDPSKKEKKMLYETYIDPETGEEKTQAYYYKEGTGLNSFNEIKPYNIGATKAKPKAKEVPPAIMKVPEKVADEKTEVQLTHPMVKGGATPPSGGGSSAGAAASAPAKMPDMSGMPDINELLKQLNGGK